MVLFQGKLVNDFRLDFGRVQRLVFLGPDGPQDPFVAAHDLADFVEKLFFFDPIVFLVSPPNGCRTRRILGTRTFGTSGVCR